MANSKTSTALQEAHLLKVDVVMPVFNGALYLTEAIESILAQTVKEWNLIILDGGSTDATCPIVLYYTQKDPRIRLISLPGTHPVERVNQWLRQSTADLIAFQHADDISASNRIERMRNAFEKTEGLVLLGCATHYWRHNKCNPSDQGYSGVRAYPTGHWNIRARLPFYWCFPLPAIMFRKSIIIENQLFFNPAFKYCADYNWYYRVCLIGKVDNLTDILLSYRHHDESDGPRNRGDVERESRAIRKNIIRSEFSDLPASEEALLLDMYFEPECRLIDACTYTHLRAIFYKKLASIMDNETKAIFHSVYKPYLKSVQPPRSKRLSNWICSIFRSK